MTYNLRKSLKSTAQYTGDTSKDDDFSASSSDWSNSQSSSSTADSSEEISEAEDAASPQATTSRKTAIEVKSKKSLGDHVYVINSDEYFSFISHRKQLSKNTLDKLGHPRLQQDQLHKFLADFELSAAHKKARHKLLETSRSQFGRWIYLLHEGFNLVLYGLGSKIDMVQEFQKEFLSDYPVVIVNGFFPSLTIKNILDSVLEALELKENPSGVYETCDLIEQEMSRMDNFHLYLIVNNIDGPMLRASKNQNVLAKLADIRHLHLVATVDHVNAPLIWDNSKLSKFNFIWFDVTTFLPYISETSFESSMIVQRSKSLALSSLSNVFVSLTSNSKKIYLAIVKYQLEHGGKAHYQGFMFKDLYWTCREAFLVSSDLALRSQLTEFVDHKMLKFRRSADGSERVIIPMAVPVLKQFLDEQDK